MCVEGADRTMLRIKRTAVLAAMAATFMALVPGGMGLVLADQPHPWQLGMQQSASPVMDDIVWFHDFLLWMIAAISLFVLALLVIVIVRFNARANPTPSKTTHNTLLEVAWTLVPVLILVAIAVPSFRLLFLQQTIPEADLTIKATGKQWYWTYTYPDSKIEFDSYLLREDSDRGEQPRLLAVDNALVVPVNKVVRVQVIGGDVIHAFGVPAFGFKIDAIPGRLNETWFRAEREGMYYGQCYELCGRDHAFMPIAIRVVSEDAYKEWLTGAEKKFAIDGPPSNAVAAVAAD